MATPARSKPPLGAGRALLLGTLTVGGLDLVDAMTFWALYRQVKPLRILQAVASGLLGRASFDGGLRTAALGAALHFFIAFSIVGVYWLASRRLTLLVERPVLCGILYGLAVYGVMTFVVVPLSAASHAAPTLPNLINGLAGHALLIGLPSALFARRA